MRQKVALAGALITTTPDHSRRTAHRSRRRVRRHVKIVQDRVRLGCTVIMTTHILEVAERMAAWRDRLGAALAEGTLSDCVRKTERAHQLEDMFVALVDARPPPP